ncbi:MAG: hypothetical protein J6F31_01415 [Oscillospiraceae bacterium]|nr:hypothetical protein [Oscillospiraceae bacterium]
MAMKIREREEIADLKRVVNTIRNGIGKASDDFLIGILGLDRNRFAEISGMIKDNPDKSDQDIANTILFGQ